MKQLGWIVMVLLVLVTIRETAAAAEFDHYLTGFDLEGMHREVPCESCHVQGVFRGTPRECGTCHDGTGLYAQSARSVTHPTTTANCEACHVTANWVAIGFVDHVEVLGSCSSCHDGNMAEGTPPGHIQTSQECDACHTDVTWSAVIFDHDGIASGCAGCHNGNDATGKSPDHFLTTDLCEDCHAVNFWEPVYTMDHAQVIGSCVSCHDGQRATGKDREHILSSDQCDECHSTSGWEPAFGALLPGPETSSHTGLADSLPPDRGDRGW